MAQHKSEEKNEAQPLLESGESPDLRECLDFLAKWNSEVLTFYFHRTQQYAALPLILQSCRSMEDLNRKQSEFIARLFDDYRNEVSVLSAISESAGGRETGPQQASYESHILKAQEEAILILEQAKSQAERIIGSARKKTEEPGPVPRELSATGT